MRYDCCCGGASSLEDEGGGARRFLLRLGEGSLDEEDEGEGEGLRTLVFLGSLTLLGEGSLTFAGVLRAAAFAACLASSCRRKASTLA